MNITYCETIPNIETYYDLRKSVDWNNFCVEQKLVTAGMRMRFTSFLTK